MAFWSVWKENRALKERMEELFARCDELVAENAVLLEQLREASEELAERKKETPEEYAARKAREEEERRQWDAMMSYNGFAQEGKR